jgi:hypothetical protein
MKMSIFNMLAPRRLGVGSSILAFVASVSISAADDLPTKLNFDRYKGILDHSPFAVASAVIAPAATPNFAKDLFVANAARSSDGDMVTLASSSDKEFKKYLTTREPVDGYSIADIQWSDKVGETKVTISKDGQFATLTFNQAVLSQPMPNKPVPPAPGVPAPQQPFKPSLMAPSAPMPTPHVRGVIERNPQKQYTPLPRTPPPNAEE